MDLGYMGGSGKGSCDFKSGLSKLNPAFLFSYLILSQRGAVPSLYLGSVHFGMIPSRDAMSCVGYLGHVFLFLFDLCLMIGHGNFSCVKAWVMELGNINPLIIFSTTTSYWYIYMGRRDAGRQRKRVRGRELWKNLATTIVSLHCIHTPPNYSCTMSHDLTVSRYGECIRSKPRSTRLVVGNCKRAQAQSNQPACFYLMSLPTIDFKHASLFHQKVSNPVHSLADSNWFEESN